MPIEVIDPLAKKFWLFEIVEKLLQADLLNERRKFRCNKCKNPKGNFVEHGEWFEISEEGLQSVEKWRKWIMESRPYNKNGTLRAGWVWKLNQATSTADLDWTVWFEFTRREKFLFAVHCVDRWASMFLPTLVVLLLSPVLVFGLGLIYPFYYYGIGLQGLFRSLGVLVWYVLYWFRYG
jgi:hypothetical protein